MATAATVCCIPLLWGRRSSLCASRIGNPVWLVLLAYRARTGDVHFHIVPCPRLGIDYRFIVCFFAIIIIIIIIS